MTIAATPTRLLDGRVAVVTGGVGVLGRAIARRLAHQGAAVAIADIAQDQAEEHSRQLGEQFRVPSCGVGVDVAQASSLRSAAQQIEAQLGVVDVIIANAGVLVARDAIEMTQEEWDRVISVNLTGAMLSAQVFAARLREVKKPGSIVIMSSLFGLRGGKGNSAYSASKFGVIGLMQSMAAELAPDGIRVNAVCPGQIDSQMLDDLFHRRATESGSSPQFEREQFVERIPLGRLGSAEEVGDSCVFLASELSSYVTGHSLLVDGGWQVG